MDSLWQHDLTSAQLPELLASDAQTTADAQHIMPALPTCHCDCLLLAIGLCSAWCYTALPAPASLCANLPAYQRAPGASEGAGA